MSAEPMPASEVDIDAALVRSLLAEQHPDLADLPVRIVANGWDNVLARVGDQWCVRLPRRAVAAELIEHEQRWMPALAKRLPVPIPAPVRVGGPSARYPWSWSIVPWLPGETAATDPPADAATFADDLGGFLRELHTPAPADAPRNPVRGGALADRDARARVHLERLDVDRAALTRIWDAAVATPGWDAERRWVHGDVHPGNLLVRAGRLSAVIDFGDLNGGDRATDIAAAWLVLPGGVRDRFREACGDVDDDTWMRARGWALAMGLAHLGSSADAPIHARIGRAALAGVLADA